MNQSTKTTEGAQWRGFLKDPINWMFLSGLLALTPLLSIHCRNLWAKPHFQFFPLAWLALGYLVYSRSELHRTEPGNRRVIGLCLGVAFVTCLAMSVVLFSPWFAHVALILLVMSWMMIQLGTTPWYLPFAWITLLLVTLPLPRNLDSRMVQELQSWSTVSASSLLDLSQIPHIAKGNVIETRAKELFVDEACSGVDSLYSLAAVALLLSIWNRTGLLLSVLTFLSVPLWAWMGNITRLYTIAFALDRLGVDWSHGWQHTVLGLIVFSGAFLCLTVSQFAFSLVLSPFPVKTITSGPVHAFFNRLVSWPGSDPSRRRGQRKQVLAASKKTEVEDSQNDPRGLISMRIALICTVVFAVIGSASALPILGIGPWGRDLNLGRSFTEAEVVAVFTEDLLPMNMLGAQRNGFEITHRERASFFGEHSATWTFNDEGRELQISLDFPFAGFHGLEECYLRSGSELTTSITPSEMKFEGRDFVVYEGEFINSLREDTYLCYTEFSNRREVVVASGTFERGVFTQSENPTTFQVQVYARLASEPTEAERTRYKALLLEVAQKLTPSIERLAP